MSRFSLVRSRSLVVPGLGLTGQPVAAPWWRVVVGHGLAFGATRWRVRYSARSFTGSVVVVGFASLAGAQRFAQAFAGWAGLSLAVRRYAGRCGPVFGVSVPAAVPVSAPARSRPVGPLGRPVWVR